MPDYEQSLDAYTRTYDSSTYAYTYTYQDAVKPTVTSFAALSTQTVTDSDDLTVVNILVPTGVARVLGYDSYDENSVYALYCQSFLSLLYTCVP